MIDRGFMKQNKETKMYSMSDLGFRIIEENKIIFEEPKQEPETIKNPAGVLV